MIGIINYSNKSDSISSNPACIYLFKINNRNIRTGVKSVQS